MVNEVIAIAKKYGWLRSRAISPPLGCGSKWGFPKIGNIEIQKRELKKKE
jgi:hypothetical protein